RHLLRRRPHARPDQAPHRPGLHPRRNRMAHGVGPQHPQRPAVCGRESPDRSDQRDEGSGSVTRRWPARFLVASLALMLGSVFLWIRGHWKFEYVQRDSPSHLWLVTNRPRGIYLASGQNKAIPPTRTEWSFHSIPMPAAEKTALADHRSWLGIASGHF